MNIYEDFKYFIRKKLQSKEYIKEQTKFFETSQKYSKLETDYTKMSVEELDQQIQLKIMPHFKTWVQLLFEG
jgi:hypothetical protein